MNKNLFYKHKHQQNIKINELKINELKINELIINELIINELNTIDYSNNSRIKYYIGNFYNQSNIEINVDEKYNVFHQNGIFFYKGPNQIVENFPFHYGTLNPAWWWGYNQNFFVDIPCLTNSADGYNSDKLPVLTKTRIINDKFNGILVKYEYEYGWKILETFNDTIKFEDKINDICWRGNHVTGLNKISNRRLFVEKYYTKYNIGFYPKIDDEFYKINSNMFKNFLSKEEQLKYKYLIAIEGNAESTSLKWSLGSNSVVLMTKPIIEGWLMEGLLEPYIHFIPLKDDFSDLDDIIEWCKNNDEKCKEISENGKKWMEQFKNKNYELLLHKYIVNWYKNNVILK